MEKVTITKGEILKFALVTVEIEELEGVKFNYAIVRTKASLKPEIEAIDKIRISSKEYVEYEQERIKLVIKHSEKDENNKPKRQGDNCIIKDNVKFEKELEKLKTKNKEVIKKEIDKNKEVNKILEEEVEVEVFKVNLDNLPDNLKQYQVEALMFMIKE